MKHPLMNTLTRLVLISLVVLSGLACAQTGIGAEYGSRDPATCTSKRNPTRGAPTPEQVKRYLMCEMEKVMYPPYLTLLDNVQVEVGKGRPFNPFSDASLSDADQASLIYPIRGSYDMYTCSPPDRSTARGRNCLLTRQPHATGQCYRTTFGDWSCEMTDPTVLTPTRQGVAPPR